MSTQHTNINELNAKIANFQKQKQSCEADMQTLSTELGIADHNLKQLSQKAIETFGTDDVNQLSAMLNDLTTQSAVLEEELAGIKQQNEMI